MILRPNISNTPVGKKLKKRGGESTELRQGFTDYKTVEGGGVHLKLGKNVTPGKGSFAYRLEPKEKSVPGPLDRERVGKPLKKKQRVKRGGVAVNWGAKISKH